MTTVTRTTIATRLGLDDADEETLQAQLRPTGAGAHIGSDRTFAPAWVAQPSDGWPIIGISYQCDHRAEEKYGVGDLRKVLTGNDGRRFQMIDGAEHHIARFTNVNAIAISTRPLHDLAPTWGDPISGIDTYADTFRQNVAAAQNRPNSWQYERVPYQQLRAHAKTLDISPIPRTKADLIAAILAHPSNPPGTPTQWPGSFRNGTVLVLRADDGVTADILDALWDAVVARTFGFAPMGGPFGAALMLCDFADIGPNTLAELRSQWDWHDEQMAKLGPVEAQLREEGYRFFFLGKPAKITRDGVTSVRYWINGACGGAHKGKQPYGWYTLDELQAHKFSTDFT